MADAGSYDVVVSVNNCTSVTSAAATLAINTAPTITTQPAASQIICLGTSATFSVVASGTPAPTYQWKKGGTDISGATSSSYTIASVAAADAGTYSVVVTNTCGNVTSANSVLDNYLGRFVDRRHQYKLVHCEQLGLRYYTDQHN